MSTFSPAELFARLDEVEKLYIYYVNQGLPDSQIQSRLGTPEDMPRFRDKLFRKILLDTKDEGGTIGRGTAGS